MSFSKIRKAKIKQLRTKEALYKLYIYLSAMWLAQGQLWAASEVITSINRLYWFIFKA